MGNEVTKYFSKITSMSGIKCDVLPKCEQDIEDALALADTDEAVMTDYDVSDYTKGLIAFFAMGNLRDEDNGLAFLKDEADSGNADAMNVYAFACYHMSLNEKSNPFRKREHEILAKRYFDKAVDLGQVEAIFNKAICQIEGRLYDKNMEEGMANLDLAIKLKHPRAKLYLESIELAGKVIDDLPREMEKEAAIKTVANKLYEELADLSAGMTVSAIGLFNDAYIDSQYKWVKPNPNIGWVSSKTDGADYLISEKEIGEIASYMMNNYDMRGIKVTS